MTVQDLDINIKFMQSVELLYLNEDDALTGTAGKRDLLGSLARYLRLSIQMDEEYSGKGIDVYTGDGAVLQDAGGIAWTYDESCRSYTVTWGGRTLCLESGSVPITLYRGEKTIPGCLTGPDLVICRKGSDLENVAVAEIQKNIDIHSQADLESLTQSIIKLCCFTSEETAGHFAMGIYFGLHPDYCYVFVFRNGRMERTCYRFEKKTGIWKKEQPQQVIAV